MTLTSFCKDCNAKRFQNFRIFPEREFDLKKIVFQTDNPDPNSKFLECLKLLFPECEIEIRPKCTGDIRNTSEVLRTHTSVEKRE